MSVLCVILKSRLPDDAGGALVIDAPSRFEKDGCGQVLGVFAVADAAKDIAKDQVIVLLIHLLKAHF